MLGKKILLIFFRVPYRQHDALVRPHLTCDRRKSENDPPSFSGFRGSSKSSSTRFTTELLPRQVSVLRAICRWLPPAESRAVRRRLPLAHCSAIYTRCCEAYPHDDHVADVTWRQLQHVEARKRHDRWYQLWCSLQRELTERQLHMCCPSASSEQQLASNHFYQDFDRIAVLKNDAHSSSRALSSR